jgi:hypothetical protein
MDALPPNGRRVVWDLMNIFSFDRDGRLIEEWVRRLQELSPSTWSAGDPVQLNRIAVQQCSGLARRIWPALHAPLDMGRAAVK